MRERRPSDEEWRSLRAGGEMSGAPDYVLDEADRARASEASKDAVIGALADAGVALMGEGRRKSGLPLEMHTMKCWDGIYAYLVKDGCGDQACAAMHAALRMAERVP